LILAISQFECELYVTRTGNVALSGFSYGSLDIVIINADADASYY